MSLRDRFTRDHLGGALMAAAGVAVAVAASGYEIGSLRSMGSGFFPLVLGALLGLVGAAIVVTTPLRPREAPAPRAAGSPATAAQPPSPEGRETAPAPAARAPGLDRRGWACILGGLLAFVVLGEHGGLVPASLVCVFVAARGDRANRRRDALALALAMTAFGVVVFHYGLHVLLPLFAWR
jgi:hypothetical protein